MNNYVKNICAMALFVLSPSFAFAESNLYDESSMVTSKEEPEPQLKPETQVELEIQVEPETPEEATVPVAEQDDISVTEEPSKNPHQTSAITVALIEHEKHSILLKDKLLIFEQTYCGSQKMGAHLWIVPPEIREQVYSFTIERDVDFSYGPCVSHLTVIENDEMERKIISAVTDWTCKILLTEMDLTGAVCQIPSYFVAKLNPDDLLGTVTVDLEADTTQNFSHELEGSHFLKKFHYTIIIDVTVSPKKTPTT